MYSDGLYSKLRPEVKSQRRGYACRYNCKAVAYYCCFIICYFWILILIKLSLYIAGVQKMLIYALPSVHIIITIINRNFKNAQLTINQCHKGTRGDAESKPNAYTSTFSVNA